MGKAYTNYTVNKHIKLSNSEKKKTNVTIQDIAEYVNISASTVSRALNNHAKISQKTKEKIWEAAQKLGYLPNIPVYMQKQKNNIVVFLIDNLLKSANHEFVLSAQEYLIKNSYQPVIKLITNDVLDDSYLNISMQDNDIVGVISLLDDARLIGNKYQKIINSNIPLVTINKSDYATPSASVIPDIYNGAHLAVNHLLKQGAKNIFLIIGETDSSVYNDMEDGFNAAFKTDSNISFRVIKSSLKKDALKYEFDQLIQEKVSFDGVIACDNSVASYLHAFFTSKKINIPDKVMLVSFGNELFDRFMPSGISTVEYSSNNMGMNAADQLIKIINDIPIENNTIIEPVKLIIRASSMRVL